MEGTSVGLGDAMLLANQNKDVYGAGGGWFMWIIILFWLMAGNNGWGNNGNNAATQQMAADLSAAQTRATVWESNDNQSMENSIRDVAKQINQVGDGIASSFVALNSTLNNGFTNQMRDSFGVQQAMMGGFNNVAQSIAENRFAAQQGFCGVTNAIQGVNYNAAMNTCAIEKTSTANTQAILDKLSAMEANAKDAEIAQLRQDLANANLAYSQQAQNAQLIAAIRPFPAPCYTVSSPYGTSACNCGCGVGV